MSTQIGAIIPGTLPTTCYPADAQVYANTLLSLATVQFPGLTGVVISDTQPVAADRDKLWIKTSALAPVGQFIYFNGMWVWPHQVPAAASERRLWVGLEADLPTYDGGDALAAGPASGAMWVVDHTYDGRVPLGPGTVPGTSSPIVTVSAAQTGGEGQHTQTVAELPAHNHPTLTNPSNGFLVDVTSGGVGTDVGGALLKTDLTTGNTGGGTPFNILQPYLGTFLIKRSGRVYYRGA